MMKEYEVLCDGFMVTVEFQGTYEECKKFIEENQKDYEIRLEIFER